ncbi:MAG TPA: ABC transporter permease [Gemmataceae bacterium]|jgi:ABC transporter DrrB family efflux protein|nr:ABC transporter permease [Gemmataceae bacterium]
MYRLLAFKEILYSRIRVLFREPEVLFWVFVFPLLLAVGLGIAFWNRKPEPLAVDIVTRPGSPEPEKLAAMLNQANMKAEIHNEAECNKRYRSGKTALFLWWDGQQLTLGIDPTRPESVTARYQIESIIRKERSPQAMPEPKEEEQKDPGSRYIDFFIPGLMGMNLLSGGLWGVGFVIVDMRVRKLLKLFLATPMKRSDMLIGIMLMRIMMIAPEMIMLLVIGNLLLGVPIRCNPLTLLIVLLIGGSAFMGIGILLGCRTEKPEAAIGMINLVMLPQIILCGVFFSSKKFPEPVQPFLQALPLTQMNDCLREVMLEGKDLFQVAWRLGILAAFGVVTFALALRWFRWT